MGKASWDARVTGLGPRDVPENDKRRRVGQSVVDAAAWREQQGPRLRDDGDSIVQKHIFLEQRKRLVIQTKQRNTSVLFSNEYKSRSHIVQKSIN